VLTRLTLAAVLLGAAVLRLWRLDQNGYGNQYYTAGVRSMTTGWRNFLYNAFDPAGFVSVDKPPVALWIQVTSVKLFGFQGLSVLVPQVLEGVAAVWIVYHLVQRRFGAPAGLLAGLFLAVTPVSVAVDRSSNTESCLILVLLLAAWALIRAAEDGSRRFLLLSMALVGVGFNVKMLAAFVVLPAFALVYLLGTPLAWRRRLIDAATAALVLVAVSASWVIVYDVTPPAKRPYAGTTDTNSIAELVVGPYGIGRFVRQVRSSVAAGGEPSVRAGVMASAQPSAAAERPADVGPRTGLARLFVRVPAGPLRLADGQLAGQVGWLLPLAIMGVVLGARRERFRRPLAPVHLSLILWFAWAVIYGVVYSAAGGIFHFYYLSMMAPPLAALGGIGVVSLWQCFREGGWRAVLLPVTLLVTAAWQLYVDASALGSWRDLFGDFAAVREQSGAWRSWLHVTLAGGALAAAGTLLIVGFRPFRTVALGALTFGVVSSLVLPVAWALSSVLVPGHGVLPSADLTRLLTTDDDARARSRFIDPTSLATLIGFLRANRGKERYLLATSSTTLAAPIIIQTGEPVMARGGFHGLDPILTPEKLARMVEADELRFVMLGDLSLVSRRMGADIAGRPIADWVRANGKPVDPALWRGTRRGLALYDLRPDLGLRSANPPA
jgi:4-amino-4-deoxy-L-arabinose transferase-like glycosyltransferase